MLSHSKGKKFKGKNYNCLVQCDYPGCTRIVTGYREDKNALDVYFAAHELWMWQALKIDGVYRQYCARCYFKRVNRTAYREQYLNSMLWKIKRHQAIERAGARCEICDCSYYLDVHHRTYENLGDEKPDDLMVLCRDCHTELHETEEIDDEE